ncbi:MAG: kelch repeat-containing protein [Planctomycetota bacterium]
MRHLLALSCLLAATSALRAQGDFDFDKVTPGTLGSTLSLQIRNANPNMPLLGMVSTNAGPTPIALVDPLDPRSVAVGIDLLGNWSLQLTSPTGTGAIAVAIPGNAAFQGFVFYWQCATLPGVTTLLDELSNPVTTMHALPATSALLPYPLQAPRAAANLVKTPTRNAGQGDFLLISGATSEFFGFRDLNTQAGPAPTTPRALHGAATLNDGRLLLCGGIDATGAVTTSCEIYDPVANTFTPVAPMLGLRAGHTAATLPDGRVLAVGGTTNFTDLTVAITASLNTAEIYNPATNSWAAAPAIGGRRLVPALTKLNNGRMLISGGIEVTILFGIPIALTSTNKAQLYNPATNAWTNAPNMPFGRAYHHDNQVTLNDGRVLLAGGVLVPDLLGATNAASIPNADLYNPTTNSWATTLMSASRTGHAAALLGNGDVIVCGGASGLVSAAVPLDSIARFTPGTNTWADLGVMTATRIGHAMAVLPDGMLVIVGGSGTSIEAMEF